MTQEKYEEIMDFLLCLKFTLEEGSAHCKECGGVNVMLKDIDITALDKILKEEGADIDDS